MPKRLILLITLYTLFAIVALLRAVATTSFDLFTLGVLPVLFGILTQAPWSSLVLKIYIGLQTLGLSALGVTAIIAYQITPQDVKVVVEGHNIPMLPLVLSIIALLLVQYWIAFSRVTRDYLTAKLKA
ncbi:hypothetical protein FJD32_020285 [Shewanella sp. LC6]|uniref:hypothetical protein n=1 Tax=Shewanella TaxID=22 RepID=UPI0002E8B5AE|nr:MULTISPECIES: hypothetical protein [Shewanella]MDH1625004.1 hypothetical protein [Shewanella xiamenensis]PWH01543.1 hypothetical protein DIY08_17485 [Shewanella xiamenensis]QQK61608.1 hypothetical protein FJD32_020285 [Shewanella sp. LC6]TPE65254.1 hypothetical protein FJD33_01050 [Shewanella sp. LC2]